MRAVDAVEHDLKFTCNECGKVATRVRVLEPDEVPEAQDEFGASLTSDARRLCVEVDGFRGLDLETHRVASRDHPRLAG